MLSLLSATSSLSVLPPNYAVDLAPYWLLKKKKGDITTAGLRESYGPLAFKQTFVLSFAIRNTDSTETELSPNTIYSGLGFKFSLARGDYDATTRAALDEIKKWQDIKIDILTRKLSEYKKDVDVLDLQEKRKNLFRNAIKEFVDSAIKTDAFKNATPQQVEDLKRTALPRITERVNQSEELSEINGALDNKLLELKDADMAEANAKIKEIAASFQTARVGFTWDIAGGISGQFINKRLDSSKIYNAGLWTTLGYTSEKFGSALFLARLLHNPDKIFANDNAVNTIGNITTFDFGGRYVYSKPQSKFNASLEGVYRSVLSSNTIKPSWRIIFNADYSIWQNQKLTFSFGRDFDGTVTKDGTLIAALSFLTGFGNKR
jgi:hypothetical protein